MSDRTALRPDALSISVTPSFFAFSPGFALSLFVVADALALLVPGALVLVVHVGLGSALLPHYVAALGVGAVVALGLFRVLGLYAFDKVVNPMRSSGAVLITLVLVHSGLLAAAFAFGLSDALSRVWFFSAAAGSVLGVWTGRIVLAAWLARWAREGRLVRRIAVLGGGEQGERFLKCLRERAQPWIRVVGVFDDRLSRIGPEVAGVPVRGTSSDLMTLARHNRIDDVIVALPWSAEMRLLQVVEKVKELPVHVRLSADLVGYTLPLGMHDTFGDIPIIDAAAKPLDGWRMVVKVVEDKVLAVLLLVLLAPVFLAIAIAIKLDSRGPVFFLQDRYGFNNQVFRCWKFRSMSADQPTTAGVPQARRNDPRVTRVGRFIRRTSLDELPQLFNVLLGEMSLVGPRPHAVAHNEEYARLIDGYFARHKVRPGITGWAQVNGLRGETDTPEKMRARVQHDVYYIENWSLAFDLVILFRTAFVGFVHKNAY